MDMRGRVVLVTGSTDGIGRATAQDLARRGASVLLHGRDRKKGERVEEEVRRLSGNRNLDLFIADFSSPAQVRQMAGEVEQKYDRLHVLINNAGTFRSQREITEDGLEATFAVNYLSAFQLTNLLLPLIKKSAPSRIVNLASVAHWNGRVDWQNLQGERSYDGFSAYALSKLGMVLFTYALAERLKGSGVTANCLHPGVIKTKLLRAGFGDYPGESPEKGARTPVYLAASGEVEGVSGQYFENCRPRGSSPQSYNRRLQEEFWRISEELSGLG